MGKLVDKIAIVTGAARGIGAKIAVKLASEGAKIAVVPPPARRRSHSAATWRTRPRWTRASRR